MQSKVTILEKGKNKYEQVKEHIKLKEHRYILKQDQKAFEERNKKKMNLLNNQL